jgi:hypothetical protein
MTARKFSISVPEDVAAAMEVVALGEVSAYVTEALRRRQNGGPARTDRGDLRERRVGARFGVRNVA